MTTHAQVHTLESMGQPASYQPRCRDHQPPWAGDVHASRAAAQKECILHDSTEHSDDDTSSAAASSPLDASQVDELLNQFEANSPRLAPIYAAHFNACTDAGFTREEALVLTSDWARVTLWGASA